MGKEISLFSGYDQSENRTTNYCLLLLRMLYQESPKLLAEVLADFLGEQSRIQIGVQFNQQISRTISVPDGFISQSSFTIYIETKNYDWFYDDQLERHLEALSLEKEELKILIALANFETDHKDRFNKIESICKEKYEHQISFISLSFEDFIDKIQKLTLSVSLREMAADFRQYLDSNYLLPNWRGYMDICNCAREVDKLIKAKTYICPATGGAHRHQRCEYLGMYWNKGVWQVAKIRGVVDVYSINSTDAKVAAEVLWNNDAPALSKDELIDLAIQKFKAAYIDDTNWNARVFVLDDLQETEFIKDSFGGMRGKRYVKVGENKNESAGVIAQRLRGKKWTDLGI